VNFDCGCKKPYYAYVYPNQPYNIYLCRVFWTAPLTGTDSKAGTLIHEMSHFTVVASTDDYVYGQSGAKSLAISNPSQAIDNADNHEYFAENTPALQ
jgi:peptidyl-Lys metalloendopeptidase